MGTISKLDGVAIADIVKVDGIAIADIVSIGGETLPPSYANVNSFEFDGIDDEIVSDSFNAGMQLAGTDIFSISFWFYKDYYANKDDILGCGGYYTNSSHARVATWGAGGYTLHWRMMSGGTWAALNVSTGNILPDSTWVHCVVTNDGTNTGAGLLMYIDSGTPFVGTKAGTGSTTTNSNPFRIGKDVSGPALNGKLDEISIWKGTELSAIQVAEVFNSGTPVNLNALPTGPAPTTWYRMGEKATFSNPGGVGDWSLVDQGSLGVNATSVNMAEAARTTDTP